MLLSSYLFRATSGLLYVTDFSESNISIKYTSELLSSGGDDGMIIGLWDIFYIPLLMYSIWKCCLDKIAIGAYFLLIFLQLLSFLMMEVGSIFETIYYGENITLFIWVLSFSFSFFTLMYIAINFKKLYCNSDTGESKI